MVETVKPAKRLLDGMPYTPAHATDIRRLFARVKREIAEKERAEKKVTNIETRRRANKGE